MTIFINQPGWQQPAFLYATYPAAATVADSPDSASYDPNVVLQADESQGWKPASISGSHSLIVNYGAPTTIEAIAIVGKSLAGVTLEIRGSTDNFAASNVQIMAASALSGSVAAWKSFAQASYQYVKFIFSGHSSAFMVKHLAAGALSLLPFLNDGVSLEPLQADGEHLISHAGLFLGSTTSKVMRPYSLSFGQVSPTEEATFRAWANACIATARGFFFIPDSGEDTVHFGWVSKDFNYSPPMENSLYDMPAIPFQARAV